MHQSGSVYRRSHLLGAAPLTKTHATKDPSISEVIQAETTFHFFNHLDKIGSFGIQSTVIFTSAVGDGSCFSAPPAGLAYTLHPFQVFEVGKCIDCGVYGRFFRLKKNIFTTVEMRRNVLLVPKYRTQPQLQPSLLQHQWHESQTLTDTFSAVVFICISLIQTPQDYIIAPFSSLFAQRGDVFC